MASDIQMTPAGVVLDGRAVACNSPEAVPCAERILGPADLVAPTQWPGRMARFYKSGEIILEDGGHILSLFVCFRSEESSPYPSIRERVSAFSGVVGCCGRQFSGGETESSLGSMPGIKGFGGNLSLRDDRLLVGLWLRKNRNRLGKRTGPRRLVTMDGCWGIGVPSGHV